MDDRLKAAAEAGDINMLYPLIRDDPFLLHHLDKIPFVETPLHIAASRGHTQFATEIMRWWPSFARKPNLDGFTPLHLAFKNAQIKTIHRLVSVENDLVRVQGKEGKTPLHCAAEEGNIDLLRSFLSLCPSAIQDATVRNETALHIALTNHKFDAFELLVGRLKAACPKHSTIRKKVVLNSVADDGNSLLHVAVLTNQPKVVKMLIDCEVDICLKNSDGLTALEIVEQQMQVQNREIRNMLLCYAESLKISPLQRLLEWPFLKRLSTLVQRTTDEKNALLVVAVLVATATFQAVISPPGGVWQEDLRINNSTSNSTVSPHFAGSAIMGVEVFTMFYAINTTTFMGSIIIIFCLLPPIAFPLLFLLFVSFALCYLLSVDTISPWETSLQDYNYTTAAFLISSLIVSAVFMIMFAIMNRKLRLLPLLPL